MESKSRTRSAISSRRLADGGADANVEIAARKFIGGVAQALNGLAEIVGDDQAHQGRDDGAELQHPEDVAGHALGERRGNELADHQIVAA